MDYRAISHGILEKKVPIIFDIETTGLSAIRDSLIAIGYKIGESEIKVLTVENSGERQIVADFLSVINTFEEPVIIGYNIHHFDLPFILAKALKYELDVSKVLFSPRIDLMYLVKRYLANGMLLSLADITEFFDIENNDDTNGAQMPIFYQNGNFEAIRKHCYSDVEVTYKLYLKLKPLCEYYLAKREVGHG